MEKLYWYVGLVLGSFGAAPLVYGQALGEFGPPPNFDPLPPLSSPASTFSPAVSREVCNDGFDNDGNGLIDCNDPVCFEYAKYAPYAYVGCPVSTRGNEQGVWGPALCRDAYDNDHDGRVDCADVDCREVCQATPTTTLFSPPPGFEPEGSLIQQAAVGTAGVLTVAAVASAAVSLVSATAAAQSGPELARSLLPFSAVHRRQTPWGRVVEEHSGRPIAGVTLSLIDQTGKVRAAETSRRDGTFGFFAPAGTYRIVAQKDDYQFPTPAPDATLFPGETVYDGGWTALAEESILALVVVGQPVFQPSLAIFRERLLQAWVRFQVWQARLAMPLLFIGGGLTTLSFWNEPSLWLAGLLFVYVVLLALEFLLSRVARRAVGVIQDAVTGRGVGLATVRLLDEAGRLVSTRVTLASGHFFLMPAPGTYRVEVVHLAYRRHIQERLRVRKFFFGVAGIRARLTPR